MLDLISGGYRTVLLDDFLTLDTLATPQSLGDRKETEPVMGDPRGPGNVTYQSTSNRVIRLTG